MPETIAWEWIGDGESNKSLEFRPQARTDEEFGDVDVYEQVAPMASATLRATGVSTAQLSELLAIHKTPSEQMGAIYTATDPETNTFAGVIQSISWRRIVGSAYWDVEIKIPNPTISWDS